MRVLLLSLALVWSVLPHWSWAEERIAIIVGNTSEQEQNTREEVARIYLRKKLIWSTGRRIIPVNLPTSHVLRRSFSQYVLGALPEDFEEYWSEQYFHGLSPPYVLDSEEAVVQFVTVTPGAIGYVNMHSVTDQVRIILSFPFSSPEPMDGKE